MLIQLIDIEHMSASEGTRQSLLGSRTTQRPRDFGRFRVLRNLLHGTHLLTSILIYYIRPSVRGIRPCSGAGLYSLWRWLYGFVVYSGYEKSLHMFFVSFPVLTQGETA